MATLTETRHNANFLVSEANGYRSRATGTVEGGAAGLVAGTLLGVRTSGGNYIRHDADAADGSQTVAGILYEEIGIDEELERTIIVRDAEVNKNHLTYEDAADAGEIIAADAALLTLGIIARA